jgi:microcystin degradation protein MlrC
MFPEAFTSQGIDIRKADIIVVKSGYHFKIFYENIASPLCADTPGLTVFRPQAFPFRAARPIYPLDHIAYTPGEPFISMGRVDQC